jgi:hypothetical protein
MGYSHSHIDLGGFCRTILRVTPSSSPTKFRVTLSPTRPQILLTNKFVHKDKVKKNGSFYKKHYKLKIEKYLVFRNCFDLCGLICSIEMQNFLGISQVLKKWLAEFGDVSCLQFNYLRVETLTPTWDTLTLTSTWEDFVGRF